MLVVQLLLPGCALALEVIVAGRSIKSVVSSPNTGLDVTGTAHLWRSPADAPRDPFLDLWERKVEMSLFNSKVRDKYPEKENLEAKAFADHLAETRLQAHVESATIEREFSSDILSKTLEIADLSAELTRSTLKKNSQEVEMYQTRLDAVRGHRAWLEKKRDEFRTMMRNDDAQLAQFQAEIAHLADNEEEEGNNDALHEIMNRVRQVQYSR